jgi:NAD(P)-dependent dehydrogenase (short-subunit alcohol dehydrogenase family)
MLSSLLDRAMDFAVVPGYSRVGYEVRRRSWPDEHLSLAGRTVVLTGATAGLGRAAAQRIAELGAGLIVVARSAERGARAVDELRESTGNDHVALVVGDLSDLSSVRAAAAEIRRRAPQVHVLINNAGVMPPHREVTADGIELAFATNVVGPFLLTELLRAALVAGAPSRVINVTSGGMYAQALDLDDPQTARADYDPPTVYARTKRSEVVLTEEWARRWRDDGVVVHAMHPGWADTPGVQSSLPRFRRLMAPILRSPAQGADTIVWLAAAAQPARSTGALWHDRRTRPVDRLPSTRTSAADAARLWALCERLSASPR